MRYGEMVALRVQDCMEAPMGYDLRVARSYCRHTYRVTNGTKGGGSRVVSVSREMGELLIGEARGKGPDDPLIWRDWTECKHPTKFRKHFNKALQHSGVRKIRI